MTGRAAPCTCRINGNVNVKSEHSVDGGVGPVAGDAVNTSM